MITNVTFSGDVGPNLHMTIQGSGFGPAPITMPYTGTLPCFSFEDNFANYEGGFTGDDILLSFREWTPTQISIDRIAGAYGLGEWKSYPGDGVEIRVWNLKSGLKTVWRGKLPELSHSKDAGM